MQIENAFEVASPVERVWPYLVDVEKVVPCMPGAEITETVDDRHWKGRMRVKLGPMAMTFSGEVTMEECDEAAHRAVLKLSGREQRGSAASAVMTSTLSEVDGRTRVDVVQDITVRGQLAQFGRGMIQDVSAAMMQQFANCLAARINDDESRGEEATAPAGAPESGANGPGELRAGALVVAALKRRLGRAIKRLTRRG